MISAVQAIDSRQMPTTAIANKEAFGVNAWMKNSTR